jgi:7,8-dihydroneopterin aldolase/epimerase/oxygenase
MYDLKNLSDYRRIFLKNYTVFMSIGVYESEKILRQRVVFNVELFVLLPRLSVESVQSSSKLPDQLEDVFDYDSIKKSIQSVLSLGHFHLLETVCDQIARKLLSYPKVEAVRLSAEKPGINTGNETVGVEVFHTRVQ